MFKTSVSIQAALLDRADILAQHLDMSREHVIELALAEFIQRRGDHSTPDRVLATSSGRTVINQGDIFWVQVDDPSGAALGGIPHPHVVIQSDILNHSRLDTVVTCALTSNRQRASLPGNVLLDAGEANLPKPSVVETSKVSTVEKARLGDYIGTLSAQRVQQIEAGLRFLQLSFFA